MMTRHIGEDIPIAWFRRHTRETRTKFENNDVRCVHRYTAGLCFSPILLRSRDKFAKHVFRPTTKNNDRQFIRASRER